MKKTTKTKREVKAPRGKKLSLKISELSNTDLQKVIGGMIEDGSCGHGFFGCCDASSRG